MSTNNMTRAEAYSAIKSMGLQGECMKRFGKNFTMCKTADLIALINEKSALKPALTALAKTEPKEQSDTTECVDTKVRAALFRLLTILEDNGTLEEDEVEEIKDILDGKVDVAASEDYKPSSASPYSDDEIDRMFNFAK